MPEPDLLYIIEEGAALPKDVWDQVQELRRVCPHCGYDGSPCGNSVAARDPFPFQAPAKFMGDETLYCYVVRCRECKAVLYRYGLLSNIRWVNNTPALMRDLDNV